MISGLQLQENNWVQKAEEQIGGETNYYLGKFHSPFVVVLITTTFAEPGWSKGGQLAQHIPFQNISAFGEFKKLELNALTLLQFPFRTSSSYDLYYFPLARLSLVNLKIWEYKGTLVDLNLNQLAEKLADNSQANEQLAQIQAKLCALTELVQSHPCFISSCKEVQAETLLFLGYL